MSNQAQIPTSVQNSFVSPALVQIGRIWKGAAVREKQTAVMDKDKSLCHFSQSIHNLLFHSSEKKELLIFYGTIANQGNCLNCNLSLNDYGFNEENDFLGVLPESTFTQRALSGDIRILLLDCTFSGNIEWKKGKSGRSTESFALISRSHLYICKSKKKDGHEYGEFSMVILLDYSDFYQDSDGSLRLERLPSDSIKDKEKEIIITPKKDTVLWCIYLRNQCKNTISTNVIGVSLDILMGRVDRKTEIPSILHAAIEYLDNPKTLSEVGLFEKEGDPEETRKFQLNIDSGIFDLSDCKNPHSICDILKRWLLYLPNPILPHDDFISINYSADQELFIDKVFEMVKKLPHNEISVLHSLCNFLYKVSTYSSENKCSISNLAKIFGPLVLRQTNSIDELEERVHERGRIFSVLIEHHQDMESIIKNSKSKLTTILESKKIEREEILKVVEEQGLSGDAVCIMNKIPSGERISKPKTKKGGLGSKLSSPMGSPIGQSPRFTSADMGGEAYASRLETVENLLELQCEIKKLIEQKLAIEQQMRERLENEVKELHILLKNSGIVKEDSNGNTIIGNNSDNSHIIGVVSDNNTPTKLKGKKKIEIKLDLSKTNKDDIDNQLKVLLEKEELLYQQLQNTPRISPNNRSPSHRDSPNEKRHSHGQRTHRLTIIVPDDSMDIKSPSNNNVSIISNEEVTNNNKLHVQQGSVSRPESPKKGSKNETRKTTL